MQKVIKQTVFNLIGNVPHRDTAISNEYCFKLAEQRQNVRSKCFLCERLATTLRSGRQRLSEVKIN